MSVKIRFKAPGGLALHHSLRFRPQSHQRCNEELQSCHRALRLLLSLVWVSRGRFRSQEQSRGCVCSTSISCTRERQAAQKGPALPILSSCITDPAAKRLLWPLSSCSFKEQSNANPILRRLHQPLWSTYHPGLPGFASQAPPRRAPLPRACQGQPTLKTSCWPCR